MEEKRISDINHLSKITTNEIINLFDDDDNNNDVNRIENVDENRNVDENIDVKIIKSSRVVTIVIFE